MPRPASWKDDPPCGHEVVRKYQTHYCTYIRVPKLLTLQSVRTDHPDDLHAIAALQAYELWFKVMRSDLQRTLELLASASPTFEAAKLLNRCAKVARMLEQQADVVETVVLRDAGARLPVAGWSNGSPSAQFSRLLDLTEALRGALEPSPPPPLAHVRPGIEYLSAFDTWAPRFLADQSQLLIPDSGAETFEERIQLAALLSLQTGVKAAWTPAGQAPRALAASEPVSPDELLFIVVHQAFELWFKAILLEIDRTLVLMESDPPDVGEASRRMRRVVHIQRLLTNMILLPATILPMDFLKFRSETEVRNGVTYERGLSPASGTESYQFREIEIVGGLKGNVAHMEFIEGNPQVHVRFITPEQRRRLDQTSLPEAFEAVLERRGVGPIVEIFSSADAKNPFADLAELADLLLEFDQFFQLWRINHLTMVQSMIGRKSGTGFLGPEYLKETAGMGMQGEDDRIFPTPQVRPRFFERLWEARTRMQAGGG